MNLTDEEIRIKVAEACEWLKQHHTVSGRSVWRKNGMTTNEGWDDHWVAELPNYPESLDACAEFEATLSMDFNKPDQWERYMDELHCLVYPTPEEEPEVIARKYVAKCRMISAPARQRCLAYLKTKGLIP